MAALYLMKSREFHRAAIERTMEHGDIVADALACDASRVSCREVVAHHLESNGVLTSCPVSILSDQPDVHNPKHAIQNLNKVVLKQSSVKPKKELG